MNNFEVKYQGHNITLAGLENCSISQLICESGTFYEVELLEALRPYVSPGEHIVDIGAHIGNHTVFFNKVMGARVLAIEANPKAFTLLKDNLKNNDLQDMTNVLNLAISHNSDSVTLTPLSSNDPGTYSTVREDLNSSSFTCKAAPLDGTYDSYFQSRPPVLIKLDVEGAEASILRSARKTLVTYKPILVTEVLTVVEFDAVVKVIVNLGYHPISLHNATPTIIWKYQDDEGCPEQVLDVFRYAIKKSAELNLLSVSNGKLKDQVEELKAQLAKVKEVEAKTKAKTVGTLNVEAPKPVSTLAIAQVKAQKVKAQKIKPQKVEPATTEAKTSPPSNSEAKKV